MRYLVDSSASTMQAYSVLHFFSTRQVSLHFSRWVLQGIAASIGNSNFLRAFCMISLNSSSSGSMRWLPRNFVALSSSGFSIAHFCFSLRFDASDKSFQISGHKVSGLEVVCCFLVSHSPDHENLSGGFSSNTVNLVKPVHVSDNSRSPSTFQ